ncbi:MAG: biopolymer transporter ExbD [Verrucomicrobiaceae bacterium]
MASNKLRNANKPDLDEGNMDMSPMIDMVFLLLLFFLVVSNPKTIKIDPKVKPPIASAAKTPKVKYGKIVVNIHEDGGIRAEDFNTVLTSDEDIEDYIKTNKEAVDNVGHTPRLHIRGDQDAVFKYCRRVIRAGARVGVSEVVFGAYVVE